MKPQIILFLFLMSITGCVTKQDERKTDFADSISTTPEKIDKHPTTNEVNNSGDTVIFFVVIADTGIGYDNLHNKMFELSKTLNIKVDTMGRFYNKTKNLIALPDNDEDAMYAGNYFPRRFPSVSLSLEYLIYYQPNAGEKTIALVTGIFETPVTADSALTILKNKEPKSFLIKAAMYIGDAH